MSIVVPEELSVDCDQVESGWSMLKVVGPLSFELTGVIAGLAQVLADAKVSVFVLSTFDTDYLMVKREKISSAVKALKMAGYLIQ